MASYKIIFLGLVALLPNLEASDNYGKPCSKDSYPQGNLVTCDLNHNMYCSDKGVCECLVGERSRVFAHYDKTCIEVSSEENNFSCRDDIQCQLSSYGKYSRCNRDYDRCECYDENEKTGLVDNVCFKQTPPRAIIGARGLQGCSDDGDCKASILGSHSRCNKAIYSCECYDWSNENKEIELYNGTCVYKKTLGALCSDHSECRAGRHKNAVCESHPSYLPAEKVCQCPEGANCDDDGSGAYSSLQVQSQSIVMIGFTTAVMGILATKVLS